MMRMYILPRVASLSKRNFDITSYKGFNLKTFCVDKCVHQSSFSTNNSERNYLFGTVSNHSQLLNTTTRRFHNSQWFKSQSKSDVIVSNDDKQVSLTFDKEIIQIPFLWLRDHCRSKKYYNSSTFQKNADPDLLEKDLVPRKCFLSESGEHLHIMWKDGHESSFSPQWLKENFYPGIYFNNVQRCLWNREEIEQQIPRVHHKDYMESDEGLKQCLSNLVKYGFCLVDGAPASIEGTQAVVEKITFILKTLFGTMWSFKADAARSDTAYSTLSLGAHTDTTYYDHPAGMQVFHCLKHNGSGGKTLLVDGFHAINEFQKAHPRDFQLLSQLVIPHEYKEPAGENSPGYHLYSLGTVIKLHPSSKEVLQLRFNPYDRAPLNTVSPQQQEKFYQAYDKLAHFIAKEEGEFWIKLKPGSVLLIDNWRVMHGRSEFDGERIMCGCYLPRDEWLSKARMLGLL